MAQGNLVLAQMSLYRYQKVCRNSNEPYLIGSQGELNEVVEELEDIRDDLTDKIDQEVLSTEIRGNLEYFEDAQM